MWVICSNWALHIWHPRYDADNKILLLRFSDSNSNNYCSFCVLNRLGMLHIFNLSHKRFFFKCARFRAKVKMGKFTHQHKIFRQTFIHFFSHIFLEIDSLVCLTVINKMLFDIVVHLKHCSRCVWFSSYTSDIVQYA